MKNWQHRAGMRGGSWTTTDAAIRSGRGFAGRWRGHAVEPDEKTHGPTRRMHPAGGRFDRLEKMQRRSDCQADDPKTHTVPLNPVFKCAIPAQTIWAGVERLAIK